MLPGHAKLQVTEFKNSLDRLTQAIAHGGRSYRELRFLVIDDMAAVRSTMQILLQSLGVMHIDFAQCHWDALYKIKHQLPDVILCDYHLGDHRNGQQLLEQLHQEKLLSEGVIFLMVTGENQYPQVAAAVELAPDDYIIKPFCANVLNNRLSQLIIKKAFFRLYYECAIHQEYEKAVLILRELLETPECKHYRYECRRLIAENLLRVGELEQAIAQYQQLIEDGGFPWAKLGLARCLMQQQQLEAALSLCGEAIKEAPLYTNAYDLKAEIHSNLGQHEQARDVVHTALEIAPLNFDRKRQVINYALKAGDHQTAQAVMQSMVKSSQDSERLSLKDRLAFARTELAAGNKQAASLILDKVEIPPMMTFDEQISLVSLKIQADSAKGVDEFNRQRRRIGITPLNADAAVDVVRACMVIPDMQVAQMVAVNALSGPERRSVFPLFHEIFSHANRAPLFQRIKHEAADNLNNHS